MHWQLVVNICYIDPMKMGLITQFVRKVVRKQKWLRNKALQFERFLESAHNPVNTLISLARSLTKKLNKNNTLTMRLGVAYNLFDGEELLEYSIKSIRNNVDFVCVIWQKISYHGEKCSDGLENLLHTLMENGLIDQLYLYEPDSTHTGGEISSFKRNIGLDLCRQHGCNYHMTIDSDEFYTDEQFRFMKEEMLRGDYGTGYCRHIQYYKDSIYQLKYPERYYVTTIEKILPTTKYVYGIPCAVDVSPERKTTNVQNGLSCRIFSRNECEMHHLSFVRKDIAKKLRNGSLDKAFLKEEIDPVVEHYKTWKYPEKCMWAGKTLLEVIEVPRQFEIYEID